MVTTEQRIKILESSLDRLLSWINSANSATNFLFTITTAMLGVIALLASDIKNWSVGSFVITVITTILLLTSLLMSLLIYFPRTKGPEDSLIFFGGIAKKEIGQFEEAILELKEKDYITDLIHQCHRNAEIAFVKYTWFKRAMLLLFLSALPWVISVYLLYKIA